MCCCNSSCTVVFAGIYTLFQSVAWAILAFLGISLYNCDIEVDEKNPIYYLYFIYFFNTECATVPSHLNITKLICDAFGDEGYDCQAMMDFTLPPEWGNTLPPYPTLSPGSTWPPNYPTFPSELAGSTLPTFPDWPSEFNLATTTNIHMIVYAVLSLTWAFSSVCIIVAGLIQMRTCFAYAPWLLSSLAVIAFDVYTTITYAIQIKDSETVSGLVKMIGVEGVDEVLSYLNVNYESLLKNADDYSMIPAIIMAVLASRAIVIWLLNVLFVLCVFFASRSLCRNKYPELPRYPNHTRNAPLNSGHENQGYQLENRSEPPSSYQAYQPDKRSDPPSAFNEYDENGYLTSPKPRPFSYTNGVVPLTSFGPRNADDASRLGLYKPSTPIQGSQYQVKPRENEHQERSNKIPRPVTFNPREPEYQDAAPTPWFHNSQNQEARRRKDTPMDSRMPVFQRPNSYEEVKPQVSRTSSFQEHRNSGSVMPPDELRGQLPWSYFGPRDAPMKAKPKVPTPTVKEEEQEMPPVPVPDYTLHFGKTSRPRASDWSDQERGSRSSDASSVPYSQSR